MIMGDEVNISRLVGKRYEPFAPRRRGDAEESATRRIEDGPEILRSMIFAIPEY
jgi:hypothetical protein